jgi:nucleotide-binding universal stress UspA family protein
MATPTPADAAAATGGRIVVGFDDSDGSNHALRWAAVEAGRRGLALRTVTALGPDYAFLDKGEFETYAAEAEKQVVDAVHAVAPDLLVEHRVVQDMPAAALRAESETADLLVVGSRGRGGFVGLLLGSVSRQCVHRSRCPVVVVRPAVPHPQPTATGSAGRLAELEVPGTGSRRIVVGVDGSPSSDAALRWAADEAELTGATLEPLHSWEWLTSAGWAILPADFDPRHDAQTVLDDAIRPVRALHPDLEMTALVAEGQAAELLTRTSEGADLLVLGSRGHGEVSGMVLGSVSDYCATHAHSAVLIMRGKGSGDTEGT